MISPTARTERRAISTQPTPRTALPPRKTDSYGNPIALIPERRENAAGVEGPNTTITARIGMTTIAIESRGAIGIKQTVPIPTVPGLGATGGLKINTTTGKIEQVSVGVSYLNLVSVDFALEGCNIIITLSAGMPGTVTFVTTSQTHEIPGCRPEETIEKPQEPIGENFPESGEDPPPDFKGLDPYDPKTFPPLPPNCRYLVSLVHPLIRERIVHDPTPPTSGWDLYPCKNSGEYFVYAHTIYIPFNIKSLKDAFGVEGVPFYQYIWDGKYSRDADCSLFNRLKSRTLDFITGEQIGRSEATHGGWAYWYQERVYSIKPAYLPRWIVSNFPKTFPPGHEAYYKLKVPRIVAVGSTCGVLPADNQKEIKPQAPQKPGFQPTKRKMDECCKALGRQIEEIHAALAADKFPMELPEFLSDRGLESQPKNYQQIYVDWLRKFDDIMGEWPVKVKVVTDEKQEKDETLVTVADAFGDLYPLLVGTYFDADNSFTMLIKVMIELLKIRNITTETHDLAFITNEQLGFEVDRVEAKESYPVDLRYPDDWAQFSKEWKPDEPNVLRWKNTEKDSAKAFLMRAMKTLSILEHAAVIHGSGPDIVTKARNMVEFLRSAQGLLSDLDLDWRTQLANLSKPETDQTPEIEVIDTNAVSPPPTQTP